MALTDPNDVCKMAYDGNLPMLQMKIKEDRSLATKTDEVCLYAYIFRIFRTSFFTTRVVFKCALSCMYLSALSYIISACSVLLSYSEEKEYAF